MSYGPSPNLFNDDLRVQNGPVQRGPGFEAKKYIGIYRKIFSFRGGETLYDKHNLTLILTEGSFHKLHPRFSFGGDIMFFFPLLSLSVCLSVRL